jgi:hypothetical protein
MYVGGMEIDVEDQQGLERSRTMNRTVEVKGKISADLIGVFFSSLISS